MEKKARPERMTKMHTQEHLKKLKENYTKELKRRDALIEQLKREKTILLRTALEKGKRLVELEIQLEKVRQAGCGRK